MDELVPSSATGKPALNIPQTQCKTISGLINVKVPPIR